MLRKIRIILAIIFYVGILAMFLDFTGTAHLYLSWMAKVQVIPALLAFNVVAISLLALVTILFGRIYCSVICPLGITQDIISWLGAKSKKNRFSFSPAKNMLRYILLGVYAIGCVLGISLIITLLDPYGAFGRIANSLLQPLWMMGNNILASAAEHFESYMFYEVNVWFKGFVVLGVALISLAVIAFLAWKNGRTYCNTICPVGTLLGFISRWSLFRMVIDSSKCNGCTLCERNCKASCINAKQHHIDYSRCVACGDCALKCHKQAISYKFTLGCNNTTAEAPQSSVDASKRSFVTTAGLFAASALASEAQIKMDGGLAVILDKQQPARQTRLVPAGAESLVSFTDHCVGCQLCVSACPNNVLRPSLSLTPEMSYEKGYCRPECTRCSEVCPAGAIIQINKAEKSSIQIGHAVWIRKNCVVLTDDVECGNCARHCPSGAISMVHIDPNDEASRLIPVVNEARCIGCGACENLCPARPFSAIYVEGHEVHKTI